MPQGLDFLGGSTLTPIPPPQPVGPPDPYQHAAVQHAMQIISSSPGISAQMAQQIMSEALGPVQNQIAQRQQTRSDFASQAGQVILQPGMTPDLFQAWAGTAYPQLADKPVVTNALDALATAQPATSLDAGILTPDDHANIPQLVLTAFQKVTNPQDPQQLQTVVDAVRQQAVALGKNDAGIAAATDYAKLILSRLTQQSRADLVNTLYPSSTSAGVGAPTSSQGTGANYVPGTLPGYGR